MHLRNSTKFGGGGSIIFGHSNAFLWFFSVEFSFNFIWVIFLGGRGIFYINFPMQFFLFLFLSIDSSTINVTGLHSITSSRQTGRSQKNFGTIKIEIQKIDQLSNVMNTLAKIILFLNNHSMYQNYPFISTFFV